MHPIKKTARFAGFLYLLVVLLGPFLLLYVPGKLFVPGDATATVRNILAHETLVRAHIVLGIVGELLFIGVVLVLYELLRGVGPRLAALMVITILIEAPRAFQGVANEFAVEEGGALLRRVIDNAGRSKAFINGVAATAAQLRELGDMLVDIHGQHAHQSLLKTDSQRELLDNQCGANVRDVTAAYRAWRALSKQLEEYEANAANLQFERERLEWQVTELDKLAPAEGRRLGVQDRPARQDAVAVVERIAAAPLVGQADGRERQAAMLAEEGQVVVAAVPARVFVNLLHGDDVGLHLFDEGGDFQKVAADLDGRAQALVDRQGAPGMGHIEGQ